MLKKRAPKHGIAGHTIRYWQQQARTLMLHNSIVAGVHVFTGSRCLNVCSNRDIAHAAIAMAAVLNPDRLRYILRNGCDRPIERHERDAAARRCPHGSTPCAIGVLHADALRALGPDRGRETLLLAQLLRNIHGPAVR